MQLPAHPRLLVAQTGFLGDTILTTPLLSALRQALTPASLSVLTTPQAAPLLAQHPMWMRSSSMPSGPTDEDSAG